MLDDDEVVDYMILEAVSAKVNKEDQEAIKKEEVERWKKKRDPSLEALR